MNGALSYDRLRELLEAATPGPWRWEINRKSKIVEICGGPPKKGFGRFDLTVMSFVRWGMNQAAPRFWRWNSEGGWVGKPGRADEFAKEVPGREHHASWFADIDHPDAQIMVAAVNALPSLLTRIADLEGALQSARGHLLNAKIDLETGRPKKTAIATIEGGLRALRALSGTDTGEKVGG